MRRVLVWLLLVILGSNILLIWYTVKHYVVQRNGVLEIRTDKALADTMLAEDSKDLRSIYMMRYQPYHFVIRDHFTLPMPWATLPIYQIIKQQWMEDLRAYLLQVPTRTNSSRSLVSIVACDSKFEDVLLNWLISASMDTQPPLSHILILALDSQLQASLQEHGFDSVYVDSKQVLSRNILSKLATSSHSAFYMVMVLRLAVMRLLNHWGYDVANYDTDAIILRNPEQLYYGELGDSDVIGSRGKFPQEVMDSFGLTMCAGMFMIKSSLETEEFWSTVSKVLLKSVNDQEKLNTAFTKMNLHWNNVSFTQEKNWVGRNDRGFVVTILHLMAVCRRWCETKQKQAYYVWHHGGKFSEGKIKRAKSEAMWSLRGDWNQVARNSTATGVEWLREMRLQSKSHARHINAR